MIDFIKHVYFPNIPINRRLIAVKTLVGFGFFFSVFFSWRLWTTDRLYPILSFFSFSINKPFDFIFFVIFLFSILGLIFSSHRRFFIALTFICAILMILFDQHRLQPWVYFYILILFVLSFYNWRVDDPKNYSAVHVSVCIVLSSVYFWSGLNKLNSDFSTDAWINFIEPLKILPEEPYSVVAKSGKLIPFFEMILAIGILFEQSKKICIPVIIFFHLFILLLLSPIFHNYNPIVFIWNFSMIGIIYFLFAGSFDNKFRSIYYIAEYKPIYPVLLISFVLPVFNAFNHWDSYSSGRLNSYNMKDERLYLSEKAKSKLPYYLQYFTEKHTEDSYEFNYNDWAMHEVGISVNPELQSYDALKNYINQITCCEDEITITDFSSAQSDS